VKVLKEDNAVILGFTKKRSGSYAVGIIRAKRNKWAEIPLENNDRKERILRILPFKGGRGLQLENEKDEELERIRQAELREMMKKSKSFEEEALINNPVEVTDATFTETVQNHPLVVIDCWAAWCGPCRMISPIIEELAREYAGKVVFGKLDVDKNRALAMKYQIMSIPTLLVFSHGKLVDRTMGALPKPVLEAQITRYLRLTRGKELE